MTQTAQPKLKTRYQPTILQAVKRFYSKNPDASISRCAKALQIEWSTARDYKYYLDTQRTNQNGKNGKK